MPDASLIKTRVSGPAYRIHTHRLVIRCWDPADAFLLQAAVHESLDHLLPWMPWASSEPEDIQVKIERLRTFRGKFDLNQDFIYGIFNEDQTRVLGGTGLHTRLESDAREIGYWIHKDFINQGLATEISAALTKVAFEVSKMNRVEIHCASDNVRSAAVPKKLGYTHEATLPRRTLLSDGKYHDTMIWALFRDEYEESPASKAEIQAFDCMGRQII